MHTGVIGLGVMGEPIARNLVNAGFALTVFNRSPAKTTPFRDEATIASSAREVFERSDAILLVLPGEREIDAVLARSGGSLGVPVGERIIVNMATVSPAYSEGLSRAVAAAGGRYVEAPVSGSREPAESATLIVLAAADSEAVIDQVQPLFAAIGRATVHCGAPPNAMRMKLANNLLLIALMESFTEAVHFARGMGLDPERFVDVILNGPMANDLFRGKAGKLLDRDFTQQAPIKHVAKDIRLICEEAQRVDAWTPGALTNAELFARAVDMGLGEDDAVGVVQVLESSRSPRGIARR